MNGGYYKEERADQVWRSSQKAESKQTLKRELNCLSVQRASEVEKRTRPAVDRYACWLKNARVRTVRT